MAAVSTALAPAPESHPLPVGISPLRSVDNNNDHDDAQVHDAFIKQLIIKHHHQQQRSGIKKIRPNNPPITTNPTSSLNSIQDRSPSSLFELKQQRILAAADRKKKIIAKIVSIVGLLIILLCAAIVTLTLKMAPKIDELVRSKAGTHHLAHLMSRLSTSSTTPISTTTILQSNMTFNITSTTPVLSTRIRRKQ